MVDVPVTNGGLIKHGTGTLALTEVAYSGDTSIAAGILSIGSASLADAADVHISSGAGLDLDHVGAPDVVSSFFIDGVSQRRGVWGAVGSGAQFTTSLITGTGLLEVTTGTPSGDFDHDGDFDCDDINGLVVEIVAGIHNLDFDLTGDLLVNGDDLTAWRTVAGSINLPSGGPYLPGDGNLDGIVDGSDFNIWNSNKFTAVAAWCSGDYNADGGVDGSDFNIWNSNKFTSSDSGAAVPEPGLLSLLMPAMMLLFARRSRLYK
jgi:autotransporter-associated beta strand protein